MAAPVTVTLRPGVTFTPEAAASCLRVEAALGYQIAWNSTYRDYYLQLSMWRAWQAYIAGTGPYPGHSRALHPDESFHCKALAGDTNYWSRSGFIAVMADHGWIRTAAGDPTEQHHFEYQIWRDNHRNETASGGAVDFNPQSEEDDMNAEQDNRLKNIENLLAVPGAGYGWAQVAGQAAQDIQSRVRGPKDQPYDQLQGVRGEVAALRSEIKALSEAIAALPKA